MCVKVCINWVSQHTVHTCMQTTKQAECHLLDVTTERSVYKEAFLKGQVICCCMHTTPLTAPSPLHHQHHSNLPTALLSMPTTVSTWHSSPQRSSTARPRVFLDTSKVLHVWCVLRIHPLTGERRGCRHEEGVQHDHKLVCMLQHFFEHHGLIEIVKKPMWCTCVSFDVFFSSSGHSAVHLSLLQLIKSVTTRSVYGNIEH